MIEGLVTLVVYVIIIGMVLWLLQYVINALPLFEPVRQFGNVILTAVAVIFLIYILLAVVRSGGVPRLL